MPTEDPHPPPVPDYELLRLVGRGSYGDVWLARGATGLYFAVKVVWRDRFNDIGPYEREFRGLSDFMRLTGGEARQLALLHVGRNDEGGFFFYVMELADDVVTGRHIDPSCYAPLTLKDLQANESFLPVAATLRHGIDLAQGLIELHAAGLIHRDIKPSNIILVEGRPKLADIGLVSEESEAMSFVGTEGFVPPEGPGTTSADIFSLGKVLYEIATGCDRNDFPRLPADFGEREDRPELLELNEIIIKACADHPADRYADAVSLLAELKLLEAGKSVRRLRFAEAGLARARKWILLATTIAVIAGAGVFAERRRANLESAGRRAAETELAELTRRTLYDASLANAQRALEIGNYGVARVALDRAIPQPGDPDLRGFEWHVLYREAQGDPAEIIRKAGANVTRLKASPDGRWIAVDNASGDIEIYDQQSGAYVRTLDGIHRIAGFTSDGQRLVGTTPKYAIESWSVQDGAPSAVPAKPGVNRPLKVHSDRAQILYFEDGIGDEPHRLGIWNFETGKDVLAWPIGSNGELGRIVFMTASATPDLSRVLLVTVSDLAGNRIQLLRVIDMQSGEILHSEVSSAALEPAAISPDGRHYTYRTNALKIGSIDPQSDPPNFLPIDLTSSRIVYHRNGHELLGGSVENKLILIDSKTGSVKREFIGSGNQIDALTFSADHNFIWSADRQGEVRRWPSHGEKALPITIKIDMLPESRMSQLEISRDSKQLLVRSTASEITVLDLKHLKTAWTKRDVASVLTFETAELVVLTKDRKLLRLSATNGQTLGEIYPFQKDAFIVSAIASPNGRLLLVFSDTNEIVLWDLEKSERIANYTGATLDREPGEFLGLVMTDDGWVISTDIRQKLLMWQATTGSIEVSETVPAQPGDLYLSPQGNYVVVSGGASPTTIRNIPSLEPILTIEEGRRNQVDYAFHPSEPVVVTQLVRGSLISLDIETGHRSTPLEMTAESKGSDLSAMVSAISFSDDGNVLATVDHTGRIRIWRR